MKIIAFYLPQFHEIPENNEWWGEGFTEWMNVKKAQPLYNGHKQPRVPLNNNYYNLLDPNVLRWQTSIAQENGIYGFCFYHYWFNGHMLLEKPVDMFLEDKQNRFPYCICWANEHWTNAWTSGENKVLIEQNYGGKTEWIEHYKYLRNHFMDSRYIKNNNKPLFVVYRPEIIPCVKEMLATWNECAIEDGFSGIEYAYQNVAYDLNNPEEGSFFDYDIEYQPGYARTFMKSKVPTLLRRVYRKIVEISYKLHVNLKQPNTLKRYSYEDVWEFIINTPPISDKSVACGFVNWDNTPRRGNRGVAFDGFTPELFQHYMHELILKSKNVYKKDYMFLFAWNEWAEGGYLEPDEEYGYGALHAIKNALIETGEFPVE